MSIAVRPATPKDAETLSRLAAETFVETFGPQYPPDDLSRFLASSYEVETVRRSIEEPANAWFIAETETGEAVGYAQVGPCGLPHADVRPTHGEIKRIYARASEHGTGLGRALMDTCLTAIAERFDGPIWLGVWSENYKAQRFYERFGFAKAGEYQFVVGDTRDHEFIMRRG